MRHSQKAVTRRRRRRLVFLLASAQRNKAVISILDCRARLRRLFPPMRLTARALTLSLSFLCPSGKVDEKATQLHAIASLKVLLDATKPQDGANGNATTGDGAATGGGGPGGPGEAHDSGRASQGTEVKDFTGNCYVSAPRRFQGHIIISPGSPLPTKAATAWPPAVFVAILGCCG